ncbi:MAG: hypothetical protein O7G88_15020 [bacterium]|nr:hypothetical protein [bacterium]
MRQICTPQHNTAVLEFPNDCQSGCSASRVNLQFNILPFTSDRALMATKGFAAADAEPAYLRARELGQQTEDTPKLVTALRGLQLFYNVSGKIHVAREVGEQMLRLAERQQDPEFLAESYRGLGMALWYLGELVAARDYFEQGLALHLSQDFRSRTLRSSMHPQVQCLAHLASLGYPDQALARGREALEVATEMSDPFNIAWARQRSVMLALLRREVQACHEHAEAVLVLATEHGFTQIAMGATGFRGWALVMQGHVEAGLEQILQSDTATRAMGVRMNPWMHAMLAEAYGRSGQIDAGLHVLADALTWEDDDVGGKHVLEAEHHRLTGALLLQQRDPGAAQAETSFHQALDVARHQHAKSLELRAATSLARLWQQQDKRPDAYDLLAPVYNWFTEGFDTADLQEAKALLGELA